MDRHKFVEQPIHSSIKFRCYREDCGLPPSADVHDVATRQFGEDFGGSYETVGTPPSRTANDHMAAATERAEQQRHHFEPIGSSLYCSYVRSVGDDAVCGEVADSESHYSIESQPSRDEKSLSRTLAEIQTEWRDGVQALFIHSVDRVNLELNVAVLGNGLLLESNLSGQHEMAKFVKEHK